MCVCVCVLGHSKSSTPDALFLSPSPKINCNPSPHVLTSSSSLCLSSAILASRACSALRISFLWSSDKTALSLPKALSAADFSAASSRSACASKSCCCLCGEEGRGVRGEVRRVMHQHALHLRHPFVLPSHVAFNDIWSDSSYSFWVLSFLFGCSLFLPLQLCPTFETH